MTRAGAGMTGGHRSVGNDEWLTPRSVVDALGPFDLDPCSPVSRPWPTAARHLTVDDDGLATPWPADDFVWMNPPYGRAAERWLRKLAAHPGGGIALVFARTETAMFFEHVWTADALLFLRGRITFHYVTGERASANSGAPSVLVGYGRAAAERLTGCGIGGQLLVRRFGQLVLFP